MDKFLMLYLLLFFALCQSQNLQGVHLEEIANHNMEKLDNVMIQKFGFTRVKEIEDLNQRVYSNNSDKKENLLVITVIKKEGSCSNILSIVNSSFDNMQRLRAELPTIGYVYAGKKRLSSSIILSQYVKDRIIIALSDEVTATGAYQILLVCNHKMH